MDRREKNFFIKAGFLGLACLYLLSLILAYLNFDKAWKFGFHDQQLLWQGLSDLSQGKVPYKDFYFEYGTLYLLLGLPFFLLFGKTYLGVMVIQLLIFPFLAVLFSFLLGRQLLKGPWLILFLFLLYLYGVNNDFVSLRRFLPELGLVSLILGIELVKTRRIYLGSLLLGLSLLSSFEYALAAHLALLAYFFLCWFKKTQRQIFLKILPKFLLIEGFVGGGYALYLWRTGALKNMLVFMKDLAQAFYYNNPVYFPRLYENFSLALLQRFNFYLLPLVMTGLAVYLLVKRKNLSWFPQIFPLLIYALLIFYRMFNTPAPLYLSYNLTFLFLVLILLFSRTTTSLKTKYLLGGILLWFAALQLPVYLGQMGTDIKKLMAAGDASEKFLPVANVSLPARLVDEYLAISEFIQENSAPAETIFVYPSGPYYQLAHRERAVSVPYIIELPPSLAPLTLEQLKAKPPKLVIINVYNISWLEEGLNNLPRGFYSEDSEFIFDGVETPVEAYIAENYEISKKFAIAWVMQQKGRPGRSKELFIPVDPVEWQVSLQGLSLADYLHPDEVSEFKVQADRPLIRLLPDPAKTVGRLVIPIKVDLGWRKPFSKHFINVYAISEEGKAYLLSSQIAHADWQEVYVDWSGLEPKVNSLAVLITENMGFFWWGRPERIFLKPPQSFIRNPELKLTTSEVDFPRNVGVK